MAELPIEAPDEAEPDGEERLILSARDFERLLEIINDPAPPTPQLAATMRVYQQLKAEFPDNNF